MKDNIVQIWNENIIIPTYQIGKPDKNPMFLEKRVYQGSSGKVYPYPTIEIISDTKTDVEYHAVYLENEYLKVMILPELGGRIQRAYDKTNDYDFVYYNHVIKPALVGLTGPWISGGIEFNWPQHHRPDTYLPVDYSLKSYEDGSKAVLLNDVDRINGTKSITEIKLYPGKAYIEISGQLYNRTSLPQTFLWWANPAVPVNENTQSVFPPDVHAVMDHGKRDVSDFPIAHGVYYKHDYSAGVDISRYINIPVPTSYMAAKSNYDFVGGYDYKRQAGILHVADHHISPGKKQWTWGCGDFGKTWDRNLTDGDGPYVELMTGVYTDNQPDFTWLKPFEEKNFHQYFMPYKKIGYIRNATKDVAVNLEFEDGTAHIRCYATSVIDHAVIILKRDNDSILEETVKLSPTDIYDKTVAITEAEPERYTLTVTDDHRQLIFYRPEKNEQTELPAPAQAAAEPGEIGTNEELLLTGLHIEQYRHATFLPDPYYLEGLRRDPDDSRINNCYGRLLLNRGCFEESIPYFRKAIKRLTWKNPNPYNSEPLYNLAYACFMLERYDEAFDLFYKSTWSMEQQEMSFYYLAAISVRKGKYEDARNFIEQALIRNTHQIKARGLKAVILRKLDRTEEAQKWIVENLAVDPFDYVSRYEKYKNGMTSGLEEMQKLMHEQESSYLALSADYAEFGLYPEAVEVIRLFRRETPMPKYAEGKYLSMMGNTGDARKCLEEADQRSADYVFPNRLEDIPILQYAINAFPEGARACYYLGCLMYDRRQYEKAGDLWKKSSKLAPAFPTVYRNLALYYFNKKHDPANSIRCMEKAFDLAPEDARVFMELDQLYKKVNRKVEDRKKLLEKHLALVKQRDDLSVEYCTLLNETGNYEAAYSYMMNRTFHPWEGGEGKVSLQYKTSLIGISEEKQSHGDRQEAINCLLKALENPDNLGEGKLEGTKDNDINYKLGCLYSENGDEEMAKSYYEKAIMGAEDPAGAMYYNDQPADMILYQGLAFRRLGNESEADRRFNKLIAYGKKHMDDHVRIDYFAVSLPDLQIFEADLDMTNKAHCHYLVGLGNIGLGELQTAKDSFEKTICIDNSHQKARKFLMCCDYNNELIFNIPL
jgi:tetratricopeptide (TPR) repeat protein